jgi:hypothetical protein
MTPVMAVPPAAMMAMMPADILGAGIGDIILIGNGGFCGRIRLRTIHQILLRRQHRRCARCRCSRCDRTCASGDAKCELEKITTFHQLFSL